MGSGWPSAVALVLVAASAVCGDDAASGRLSSRDFDKAYPGQKVFAASAKASSSYGRGWDADQAAGAPRVFPRLGDNRGAWACKDKRSRSDWLEVEFPATEATTVLIYETCDPGAVSRVLVDGQEVYASSEKPGKFNRSQVLWIRLAPARSVTRVRVEVDASRVPGWPQIDAVALVPAGGAPSPAEGARPSATPAKGTAPSAPTADPDAELSFEGLDATNRGRVEKAAGEVEALAQRLAAARETTILVLDGDAKKTIHDDLLRSARYWLGNVTPRDHPAAAIVAARIARVEAALGKAKEAWEKRLAELGDLDQRCGEQLAWIKAHAHADRARSQLLPPAPKGLDPALARAWAPELAKGIKELEQRLAFLEQVQRLDPRFQIKGNSKHTPFLNALRRAAGQCQAALRQPAWAVEAELDAAASAVASFKPAALSVDELRRAGFAREAVGALRPLDQAQVRMAFASAFYEAFGATPARCTEVAGRVAGLAAEVEARLTAQIASERLTSASVKDAALLAQGQALVKAPLRLAVSEATRRLQGKWTEKDLISETRRGDTLERKFRVKNTPYDYERGWLRVARPLPDRPGHCLVSDVELQLNHLPYGNRKLGAWYLEHEEPAFVMLEKNLPPEK